MKRCRGLAGVGATVHAGTINTTTAIEVVATATDEGTLVAEIARLMHAAEQARGRYVRLADRAARLYAPAVHALGAMTFVGWMLRVPAGSRRSPSRSPCLSSRARARWRSPCRRCRWRRAAACSPRASSSRRPTHSNDSPRSTRSCSTRPGRSRWASRDRPMRMRSIRTCCSGRRVSRSTAATRCRRRWSRRRRLAAFR